MLILSRKLNESIVIDGRIIVKVLRIDRDTVKLGIQAPADLQVHRQEVFDAIQRTKQQAPPGAGPKPNHASSPAVAEWQATSGPAGTSNSTLGKS
jgi:carbon storage regulator